MSEVSIVIVGAKGAKLLAVLKAAPELDPT